MFNVIFVTAKDQVQAKQIATALLEEKLVACVNMIDAVRSMYWWEGKIQDEQEVMLVIKSKAGLFEQICSKIKSLHSYAVPEIIALPIQEGNPDYLKWINTSTQ